MQKILYGVVVWLALVGPASATNVSTADPNYPATFADIDAGPMRDQNRAFINDIDNLWAAVGPNFLEANQLFGAILSGKAAGLPVPSCFGPGNALTWAPGAGFGCNEIATGDGSDLGPQAALTVLMGPISGSAAIPVFGQLTGDYLPLPSSNSLGGVKSLSPVSHQFLTGITTSGTPIQATPSFSDISGILSPSQIPFPTASTLGGTQSIAVIPHNFVTGISASGVPTQAQPVFSDLAGVAAGTILGNASGSTAAAAALSGSQVAAVVQKTTTLSVVGSSFSTDASLGNSFLVTLNGSTITANTPTNPSDGQCITYELVQDATGNRTVAWGAGFDVGGSGAPVLSVAATKRDLVGWRYSASKGAWLLLGAQYGF